MIPGSSDDSPGNAFGDAVRSWNLKFRISNLVVCQRLENHHYDLHFRGGDSGWGSKSSGVWISC